MLTPIRARMRALLRAVRCDDGIEGLPGTIIIVIGLLFFCLSALQVAFWYIGQNVAQASANTAYQQARSYQASNQDGVEAGNRILDAHSGELTATDVQVTRAADTVTVTVTGQPASIFPGLVLPPITKTLTGPIEQWIP